VSSRHTCAINSSGNGKSGTYGGMKYQTGLSRCPPVRVTTIMVKVSSPSSPSFRRAHHLILIDFPPPDHGLRSSFIFHANFMDGGTPDEINGVFLDESLLMILYNRLEAIVSERHGNFS